MNAMELIARGRGSDYRKSITGFSMQAWRNGGGTDGNEPYYEEDDNPRGTNKVCMLRIYVDARIFSTWEAWKPEAERAKLGMIRTRCPQDCLSAYLHIDRELSGNPAFITEDIPGIGTRLWINVLCPSESEFYRARAATEEEAAERKNIVKNNGSTLAALRYMPRTTKYCSLQNQRSDMEKQFDRWSVR